jgi:hypothetical protein
MAAFHKFWFIWRVPTILAALTVFGLMAALLDTGPWHWASWLTMALPLTVIGLCLIRPHKHQQP